MVGRSQAEYVRLEGKLRKALGDVEVRGDSHASFVCFVAVPVSDLSPALELGEKEA